MRNLTLFFILLTGIVVSACGGSNSLPDGARNAINQEMADWADEI